MYILKLNAKNCISCAICMDICVPKAIGLRIHKGKTIEGNYFTFLELKNNFNEEHLPKQMMTFPFLAKPELCNGCMLCVEECPVSSIEILLEVSAA